MKINCSFQRIEDEEIINFEKKIFGEQLKYITNNPLISIYITCIPFFLFLCFDFLFCLKFKFFCTTDILSET